MDAEAFYELVQSHLKDGENQILLIGGRTTNFPIALRESPRLVFWDSTDPDTQNKEAIPAKVSLVLFTRWVPHSLLIKVKAMARAKGVMVVECPKGTGELKRCLAGAVTEKPMAIATVTPAELAPSPNGILRNPLMESARELLPVAEVEQASFSDDAAILDRIVRDPELSQFAVEKILEESRKLREMEHELPELRAENERLRQRVAELLEYRELVVHLKRLIEQTSVAPEHA